MTCQAIKKILQGIVKQQTPQFEGAEDASGRDMALDP
jgi:hypothetical protein